MHLLWWEAEPLPDAASIEGLRNKLTRDVGVYCVEGSHDAHRGRGPLYIGRTSDTFLNRLKVKKGSLGHFFSTAPGGEEAVFQAADAWNIVVRWASMEGATPEQVSDVESLLIRFHKPNYNHRGLTGADEKNVVIVNVGAKGTLLPVLASQYFASQNRWPADT